MQRQCLQFVDQIDVKKGWKQNLNQNQLEKSVVDDNRSEEGAGNHCQEDSGKIKARFSSTLLLFIVSNAFAREQVK